MVIKQIIQISLAWWSFVVATVFQCWICIAHVTFQRNGCFSLSHGIVCFHMTSGVTWWGMPPPYWVTSKHDWQSSKYTIPVKSNVALNNYLPFCSCENIEDLWVTIHIHPPLLVSVCESSHPLNMEGNLCGWRVYLWWYWHNQTEEW